MLPEEILPLLDQMNRRIDMLGKLVIADLVVSAGIIVVLLIIG